MQTLQIILIALSGPILTVLAVAFIYALMEYRAATAAPVEDTTETQDDFTPAMRRWDAMLTRWGVWQ